MRFAVLSISASLLACQPAAAQEKGYQLKLGQQAVDIDPGETVEITLPDGSKADVTLTRNEFATYRADAFSFMHPGDNGVSRSNLGNGILQHVMTSALGTLVVVQSYARSDPTSLVEFMLQEMTRDEIAAGASIEKGPASRTIDGQQAAGLKAAVTLNGETADYEVFARASGASGVIIVTRMDRDSAAEDGPLMAKFWETLKFSK